MVKNIDMGPEASAGGVARFPPANIDIVIVRVDGVPTVSRNVVNENNVW
jgi:hypothetical protein